MTLSKAKLDLEHHVWKLIKHHALQNRKVLVALSGGVDSVALLVVLAKVHKKELLGACYFHHGEESNTTYRNEAQKFCKQLCEHLGIAFFLKSASEMGSVGEKDLKSEAKSEEQYRQWRYVALGQVMKDQEFVLLATAHHRDDLLETRLLRLIRGTGAQGLQAMHTVKENIFRPFLEITKEELKEYLKELHLSAIEDPSNENLDPLRNWLRQSWLKSLESRSPGSSMALARSLETIAQEIEHHPWGDLLSKNEFSEAQGISRSFYLTLTSVEQKRLLAQYMYSLGKRDFSQAQLEEIQKRLDNSQKVITFKVAGCLWEVNAGQIKVQS